MPKKIIIPESDLRILLLSNSQQDVARHFGVCVQTISKLVEEYQIAYKRKGRTYEIRKKLPAVLNKEQADFMVGSMLGDGHIDKRGRFKFEQIDLFQEYVDASFDLMKPFATCLKTVEVRKPNSDGRIDDAVWDGSFIYKRRYQTYQCGVFEQLRNVWYPLDQKIVPSDLRLNETILMHWFIQDGSNRNGYLNLHTNCFCLNEVEFLQNRLFNDLSLSSHIGTQDGNAIIVIGSRDNGCNKKLLDMIRDRIVWTACKYKVNWDESIKRRIA